MKRGAVPYFNAAESSACSATPSMPRHRCARWARMERAPSPAVERARAGLAVDRHRLLAVASNPKIAAGSHEREKTRQRVACSPGRRSTCPVRLPVPVNTGRMTLVARARTPQRRQGRGLDALAKRVDRGCPCEGHGDTLRVSVGTTRTRLRLGCDICRGNCRM